jgi:hypothetical protein
MADVEIRCPHCLETIKVSEFADFNQLKCRSCNRSLEGVEQVPQLAATRKAKRTISPVVLPEHEEDDPDTAELLSGQILWREREEKLGKPVKKEHVVRYYYAWLVFFVIAAIMVYLRYWGGLPPEYLEYEEKYAGWVLVGLNLIVTIIAFEDSVYQGILCLLIPGYSLYYLFLVSDAPFVKAIVAGILVGVGQDGGFIIQREIGKIAVLVRAWIASGG